MVIEILFVAVPQLVNMFNNLITCFRDDRGTQPSTSFFNHGEIMDTCTILKEVKSIAVVGISDKPDRDSGRIAEYLKRNGYNVYGIHPILKNVGDIPVVKDFSEIPEQIDVVNLFVNGARVGEMVEKIIEVKPKVVWMQLGVYNEEAKANLEAKGIKVIMNTCIATEHRFCR